MRKMLSVLGLTLVMLVVLDLGVGAVLRLAEAQGRLGSLVQYFDYGRSVPGKLQVWRDNPGAPGNLYDVAWLPEELAQSGEDFAAEPADTGPVIRSYGMSFVNNILTGATEVDASITLDLHAGPGASPNYVYTFFHEDRANRRAGDVVVLGILSSSVPAMAAMSNRSWNFEQPSPFTYPIYRPGPDESLIRTDPLVASLAQDQAMDAETAAAWDAQLAREDAFHSPVTFGLTWADASPFARLVRRALAQSQTARLSTRQLETFPHGEVLRRMIGEFAATARADGQYPVVVLVQTQGPLTPDLFAIAEPVLSRDAIPYLWTPDHADPRRPDLFVPDGHYRHDIDVAFGQAFLELLEP